jgi:hypothetical protein
MLVPDLKIEEQYKKLGKALSGEDDLGMVVWAHIIIEHELEEFVRLAAPEPSQLKFSEMDYSAKVKLALVLYQNSETSTRVTRRCAREIAS